MTIYTLRRAGSDDLVSSDYRDIFDELRRSRSLRELVNATRAAEGRIAHWSRYQRNPDAVLDLASKNELRIARGLPELDQPAGVVVAAAADPSAVVWQIGDGPADRVILLAEPGPVTLHVNDEGPQIADVYEMPSYSNVQEDRKQRRRKPYLVVRLPEEWRSELEFHGLTVRQIVEKELETYRKIVHRE